MIGGGGGGGGGGGESNNPTMLQDKTKRKLQPT
jgi:hypothetical protein